LLRAAGIPFEVVTTEAEELVEGMAPGELALENARRKCRAVHLPRAQCPSFILGTDTVVVVGEEVLGKPADAVEAAAMLRRLSGREHEVISGVALSRRGEARAGAAGAADADEPRGAARADAASASVSAPVSVAEAARTRVTFTRLSEPWIEAYLDSGEWQGKAGAYAIQGRAGLFVEGIAGEYSNVVGLPLCLLAKLFADLGFDVMARRWILPPEV